MKLFNLMWAVIVTAAIIFILMVYLAFHASNIQDKLLNECMSAGRSHFDCVVALRGQCHD